MDRKLAVLDTPVKRKEILTNVYPKLTFFD